MRRMVIKFTFSLSLGIKLVLTLKIIKFIIQSEINTSITIRSIFTVCSGSIFFLNSRSTESVLLTVRMRQTVAWLLIGSFEEISITGVVPFSEPVI